MQKKPAHGWFTTLSIYIHTKLPTLISHQIWDQFQRARYFSYQLKKQHKYTY